MIKKERESRLTQMVNWSWFLSTGIIAVGIAWSKEFFSSKGEWLIALLIATLLFRSENK